MQHHPLFFGSTGLDRFDAPGKEFGTLYAATSPHGAFIESFGWSTDVSAAVTRVELEATCLSEIQLTRPLELVDLTGAGLVRMGADARLNDGDHGIAQRWSLAFFQHPQHPDGVHYRARRDPDRISAAVYDRARDAVKAVRLGSLLEPRNTELLEETLERYNLGII